MAKNYNTNDATSQNVSNNGERSSYKSDAGQNKAEKNTSKNCR